MKSQFADPTKPLGMLSTREQITIEYHIDKQIQWLDANTDADIEEIIKHKNQFEQIVTEIIQEFERQSATLNDTQSSHWNEGDL